MATMSHKNRSASVYCAPTLWQAWTRLWMKTVPRGQCLKALNHPQSLGPSETPWRDVKISSWGPLKARRLTSSCFLDQPSPDSAAGPQRGIEVWRRLRGTSPFSQPGQAGGCLRAMFPLTGQITLTGKLLSEPSKHQIRSSSQSKHNPFQQLTNCSSRWNPTGLSIKFTATRPIRWKFPRSFSAEV